MDVSVKPVMDTIFLLTDAPARGARLAQGLKAFVPCTMIDLLEPGSGTMGPEPETVRAIISDVSFGRSSTIGALRRHLDRFGAARPPYFCLLHEDTARGRAQALALGATRTLPAHQVTALLSKALGKAGVPLAEAAAQAVIGRKFARADAAMTQVFEIGRSGGTLSPQVTAVAAECIEDALRHSDIRTWLDIVWGFDDATHQHCLLVAGLAAAFGAHLGLSRSDCHRLTQAALLHDVGKSRIPLAVLNKPGPLDADEIVVMREHPAIGHAMLLGHGYTETMLAVVRSHHEFLDGSGYPDGLRGTAIPDLVRLVTVCDVFGALIERRPYRNPMPGADAYAVLEGMAGKLDMDLVRAFRPLAKMAGCWRLKASA